MKLFLFDRRFQSQRENVESVLGSCVKHPANPLRLDGSPDWCHDNLAGRIRWFAEDGMYKGRVTGNEGVYSRDGIEWKRGERWLGHDEVLEDPDPDPARRYKTVSYMEGPEDSPTVLDAKRIEECKRIGIPLRAGIGVGWSADGKTWRYEHPVLPATVRFHHYLTSNWGGGDGYNHIIYAPTLKKYVLFVRTNIDRQPYGKRKERSVSRLESEDLVHWTPQHVCLRPWTDWQDQLGFGKHDFYHLPVYFRDGIYWGIGSVFWWQSDTVHLELFWSPDTIHWERLCPYQDFIPQGGASAISADKPSRPLWEVFDDNPRAVDSGCNFAVHVPVFLRDEVRVYYGASPGLHNAESQRRSALCFAMFSPDRFAGVATKGLAGKIRTHPLQLDGARLRVNADARGGEIRVGVCEESGKPIPRFGLGDCKPITTDSLVAEVTWKGGNDFSAFAGNKMRLEIELRSARLYTITADEESSTITKPWPAKLPMAPP